VASNAGSPHREAGPLDQVPDHGGEAPARPEEIEDFAYAETPVTETLVRDLAGGARHRLWTEGGRWLALRQQRNVILIRGPGRVS
jgi:hypothetical protein